MIQLILVVALVIVFVVFKIIDTIRVKKMTVEKLLEKCKRLIDEGHAERVQGVLLHHPKLLLIHFNELQARLTEYARAVDEARNN